MPHFISVITKLDSEGIASRFYKIYTEDEEFNGTYTEIIEKGIIKQRSTGYLQYNYKLFV